MPPMNADRHYTMEKMETASASSAIMITDFGSSGNKAVMCGELRDFSPPRIKENAMPVTGLFSSFVSDHRYH